MTCGEIFKYLENWAPKEIAWDKDNVGLQVGTTKRKIKNILLSLDLNIKVVNEAIKKNCNLIITHHPLLFKSFKKIDTESDNTSVIIEKLLKHDITLFSSHTNLDFTKDGVSFELAKALRLKNIRFLSNLKANQYKLVIFIPDSYLEKVADTIFRIGGILGEYSYCSFLTKGERSEKTSLSADKKLNYEKIEEVKLEVLVDSWKLKKILSAVRKVLPYEDISYDVYLLHNENINYGIGAIGEINIQMNQLEFLDYVSRYLRIKNFRYTRGKGTKIKSVAVCGGSGSEFIPLAIKQGADAYITADIKYHTFFENEGKLLLIDGGHYETEILSLNELSNKLIAFIKREKIKVFKHNKNVNPVSFYNNSGAKVN